MCTDYLTRRSFIKHLGLSCAAISSGMILPRLSLAQSSTAVSRRQQKKVLIHLFLSGGLDGLSVLAPTAVYSAYTQLRNTSYSVGALSSTSSDPQTRMITVPGIGGYGFHNQLGYVAGLLQPNSSNPFRMALFNWVGHCPRNGTPGHSLSHAEASNMYERRTSTGTQIFGGWLGRVADLTCSPDDPFALISLRGICGDAKARLITPLAVSPSSYSSSGEQMFTSGIESLSIEQFHRSATGSATGTGFKTALKTLRAAENPNNDMASRQSAVWPHADELSQAAQLIVQQNVSSNYTTDSIGAQFRGAAQLLKSGLNPAAIMLEQDGYDMHSRLLPELAPKLGSLDANIEAFLADLITMGRQNDVTILIETEFGRRNYMNSANGSDHGGGALTFVIGTQIPRGVFGRQYKSTDLQQTINLPEEIDFREIRAQILRGHLGIPLSEIKNVIFPAVSGQTPYVETNLREALFSMSA